MNITKTQQDTLNAVIKVQLEKEDYASRVENTLKDYQRKAVIDGFRKGKTPMGIVKKMYGKTVLVEEINKVLGEALSGYIRDNDLQILGEPLPNETEQPELDLEAEKFEFLYDIALSPEVNVKLNKQDKVPFYSIRVDDEMIDKQVANFCKNNGEMKPVDAIDGTEYVKGELLELNADGTVKENGVKNEEASISVEYIKDEDALKAFTGAKKGTEVKFNAPKAFPNKADFAAMLGISKEEAEKVAPDFCFIVREIERYSDAEVNQELFDRVYGKETVKDVGEFRARVKTDIENQLKGHSEYRFTIDARDKMLKKNESVVLPEAFLKRWIVATNPEMNPEDVERDFEGYRDEFKWQLIKTALVKEFDLKVEAEDLKAGAREMAAAQLQQYGLYGLTDEQLDGFAKRLLEDEKQRRQLYDRAVDNKIVAAIRDHVKLDEREVSMADFEKLFQK